MSPCSPRPDRPAASRFRLSQSSAGRLCDEKGARVAVIVHNRRQSQRAYDDPALMEKRYSSVLNPRIRAALMLGIGKTVSVDVPENRPAVK